MTALIHLYTRLQTIFTRQRKYRAYAQHGIEDYHRFQVLSKTDATNAVSRCNCWFRRAKRKSSSEKMRDFGSQNSKKIIRTEHSVCRQKNSTISAGMKIDSKIATHLHKVEEGTHNNKTMVENVTREAQSHSCQNEQIILNNMSHPAEQINRSNWKIANGEYDEAIVSLTRTLKMLKLFLSGDCHAKIAVPIELQDQCDSSSGFEYDYFSLPNTPSFVRASDSTCIHNKLEPMRENNDGSTPYDSQRQSQPTVFRAPIMALVCKPLDMKVCHELSYVSIYNLALSHHLKSLESGPSSTPGLRRAYLEKALALYEHSQQLQMGTGITIGASVVHSMAVVSSLGHIYRQLGHSEKAESCSQYLLSTLMYVVYCGEVNILGNSVEGFFDMILPLVSKETTAPAA